MSNLDYVTGSTVEPLFNKNLMIEILVSDLLKGKFYTSDFIEIINYITDLSKIVIIGDEEFSSLYKQIQEKLLLNENKLNLDEVKKLMLPDSSLLKLLQSLKNYAQSILPEIKRQDEQYTLDIFNQYLDNTPEEMLSSNDYSFSEQMVSPVKNIHDSVNQLIHTITVIEEIANKSEVINVIEFSVPASFKKLPQFFLELKLALQNSDSTSILYEPKCIQLIEQLQARYPRSMEDLYQIDIYMDLLKLVKNPQKLVSKLKVLYSIDETIPLILNSIYPEIVSNSIEDYYQVKDYLTYQQQIKVEKGLGINPENASLASVCETYLYKGYNQQ